MNVAVLNNTGYTHFGCGMVMRTIENQLKRINANFTYGIDKNTDLIFVNGEGSLHHLKGKDRIDHYKRNLEPILHNPHIPSVLVNTVWQDNPDYELLKYFKKIYVRESLSLKQLPDFVKGEIMPDFVFAAEEFDNLEKISPFKDICITDNEVNSSNFKKEDILSIFLGKGKYKNTSINYIRKMMEYKRVCTGRFHGVAVAAKLGLPFSAWPSNSHKILGMMIDMGVERYHFDKKEDALNNVPCILDIKVKLYAEEAKRKIYNFFDNLPNLCR